MLPQKDSLETKTTAIDLDAVLAAVKNMDRRKPSCIAAGMSYTWFVSLKTPKQAHFSQVTSLLIPSAVQTEYPSCTRQNGATQTHQSELSFSSVPDQPMPTNSPKVKRGCFKTVRLLLSSIFSIFVLGSITPANPLLCFAYHDSFFTI